MNKLLTLLCILAFGFMSCSDDDGDNFDCGGECGAASENIIGSWNVDDGNSGTVTFNADGTGVSSVNGEFSSTYEGFNYETFTWAPSSSADYDFDISYDYNETNGPIFGITLRYNASNNQCNCMTVRDGFDNQSFLKRQ